MLKIFQVRAGGYYTSGQIIVAAHTADHAIELANEASDPKWKLHYYGYSGVPVLGEMEGRDPHVLSVHEYGLPNMPSKGSGIKITF